MVSVTADSYILAICETMDDYLNKSNGIIFAASAFVTFCFIEYGKRAERCNSIKLKQANYHLGRRLERSQGLLAAVSSKYRDDKVSSYKSVRPSLK